MTDTAIPHPSLAEAIAIMARLRGPDGCPWDREQDLNSIKRYTLEETYEVFDAIERQAWPELKDELGDLLLQVLFYSQMAAEAGYFSIDEVAGALCAKLIRRHPHVFGKAEAADASAVLRNWEQIKRAEKALLPASAVGYLDEVPRTMPAMMEASKLGSRAAKLGFDWPDAGSLMHKLREEVAEVQAELPGPSAELEEELGDLLFTAVNLARQLKVDPEMALRAANAKFRRRFAHMEHKADGPRVLASLAPEALEELWTAAKGQVGAG